MKLPLSKIVNDPTIQIREQLSEAAIERYSELSTEPPPVVVFGPSNILSDGFHRYEVARRKEQPAIEAERREGGRAEALEYAAIANLANSEPLTARERTAGLRRLMDLHPAWRGTQFILATGLTRQAINQARHVHRLRQVLPPALLDAVRVGGGRRAALTDAHLLAVAALPAERQEPFARQAAEAGWTAAQTRRHVAEIKAGLPISEPTEPRKPASAPVLTVIRALTSFFDTKLKWNGRTLTYREIIKIVAENPDALELRAPHAPTAHLAHELFEALEAFEQEARGLAPLALPAGGVS